MDTRATIGGDLKPTPPDERDAAFQFGAVVKQIDIKLVPNEDWSFADPLVIKDQGSTDYCGGYSSSSVSEDQEGLELCPVFSFAAAKKIEGDPDGYGTNLRAIGQGHRKVGALPERDCPIKDDHFNPKYRRLENWPKAALEIANTYRKKSMIWVDKGRYDVFDNIRAALWQFRNEAQSIETGVQWRENWTDAPGGVIPREPGRPVGGHAIKIMLKQRVIAGEPHLVVQNSYGEGVGDRGLFYFPREVVNRDFTYGAFNMPDLDPEVIKKTYQSLKEGDHMAETKPALQSTTLIGALKVAIPVIVMILGYLGIEITPEESASVLSFAEELILAVLGLWGLVDIVRGRYKATTPIKGIIKS